MIDQPIDAWGKLDILVNVAGNFRVNTVASVTREDWDSLRRVHMDGMMHTSHFASLHWKERGEYGRLINFTSDSAMSGVPDTFAYAAAKGGVIGLTRAAANGLVAYGVAANWLTQGSMTRMGDSYYGIAPDSGRVPSELAKPAQRPETVAPLVVYLASPAAEQAFEVRAGELLAQVGKDPSEVADMVFNAIIANQFWILTHPEWKAAMQERVAALVKDNSLSGFGG